MPFHTVAGISQTTDSATTAFFAEPTRHSGIGKTGDLGDIDLSIDLPIHSHLDFKALITSTNSCEFLLLPSAPSHQLIDTTSGNLYHSNSNHYLKTNFQPPTSLIIIYESLSNHI